jgi:hypothetical protein
MRIYGPSLFDPKAPLTQLLKKRKEKKRKEKKRKEKKRKEKKRKEKKRK